MFGKSYSAVLLGIDSQVISVEADVSNGLPNFELVGYLSSEVKEAKERVRTAIKNSGFWLDPKRVIVNLSPGDIRKSGTIYDLAIAAAVLCAYGLIEKKTLEKTLIVGELSLNGDLRSVNGVLPIVLMAKEQGFKRCFVPYSNAEEGAVIEEVDVYGIHNLNEMVEFLNGSAELEAAEPGFSEDDEREDIPDFADIHGQEQLKRSLEISAAGMHHLLMIGPPGCGKTMAAKRLPSILPAMTKEESIEVSGIYSVAGLLGNGKGLITRRPFRMPHHTITDVALIGGGKIPRPGELSLAHKGVLFLDELTEYSSRAMESMRQPLEEGKIIINRLAGSCDYPAEFVLIGAINPCKCGYYPDMKKCTCTPLQIRRFIGRISRPLWDRFDMTVEVKPVPPKDMLYSNEEEESSEMIRSRVEAARKRQKERFHGTGYLYNGELRDKDVERFCILGEEEKAYAGMLYEHYEMTTRSYARMLKVARTIADLDGKDQISVEHLSEAFFYKSVDKKYGGMKTYDKQ